MFFLHKPRVYYIRMCPKGDKSIQYPMDFWAIRQLQNIKCVICICKIWHYWTEYLLTCSFSKHFIMRIAGAANLTSNIVKKFMCITLAKSRKTKYNKQKKIMFKQGKLLCIIYVEYRWSCSNFHLDHCTKGCPYWTPKPYVSGILSIFGFDKS